MDWAWVELIAHAVAVVIVVVAIEQTVAIVIFALWSRQYAIRCAARAAEIDDRTNGYVQIQRMLISQER
ncbi:MAG: hypothetical protein JJ992_11765, partial [Planctomycetes bacterium]|nr:hypothetical protein [Planctomycetota bacterium]